MQTMSSPKILVYLIRRDVRLSDNPIFHEVASTFASSNCSFTHFLPVFVFPANQIETSGLLSKKNGKSLQLYPPARSKVGGFWRCGPHRAKFLAESVWELKESLRRAGSDLDFRVGYPDQVVDQIVESLSNLDSGDSSGGKSSSSSDSAAELVEVWMTEEYTTEEKREEKNIRKVLGDRGLKLRLFKDVKYFVDE
jgi:deoxyribodipyrimidine photo-lyase